MKRTTITALLAAGALLLAGCGSTAGTATAGSTVPAMTSSSAQSTAGESSVESSSEPSETSSVESSSESSETSSSESSPSESSSDQSTSQSSVTTVGGGADSIDAQTTAWFDTFCGAMAPAVGLKDLGSKIDAKDLSGSFKAVSKAMTTLGVAFTDAGTKLKGAPAPTFDGGDAFASKIVTSFSELGPKFTKLGAEFAKADPKDPASMQKLSSLSTELTGAMAPLQELNGIKMSPGVSAAISKIPSCAKLAG